MSRRYMLQLPPTSYAQGGKTAVLSPGASQQLQLFAAHLCNRSGGTQDLGLLIKLAALNGQIKAFTFAAAGPVTTDVTSALLAGSAKNIFTTTNSDGFVVQATKAFNLAGFTLSQGVSGAPVYTYKYWNGAAWVALPDVLASPTWAAGDNLLVFSSPSDWVAGTSAAAGGTSGLYTIWAQATTAPGQAAIATAFWLGRLLAFQPQALNNQSLHVTYEDTYPLLLDSLEGLMPYFSVPSAANHISAKYFSD